MQDEDLIRHLRVFYSGQDTTNFNVRDFIYAYGSPLLAIMYSRLFWPEYIEINDMVFLKERIEDEEDRQSLMKAFDSYGGDRQKTEQAFNLTEIPSDVFGKLMGETAEEEDRHFAERLAEMWRCRLQIIYPERRFTVEVLEPEETGGEIGVVFYQQGKGSN